ncbi:MAG: rhomboid family intramembrane serine protease [Deltaproteobacteria bacterium]|nr:rhomboid family intramembrane serine protease [Deltaproteobacteria bacterium]
MVPIAESGDPRALERWTFALEAMHIPFTLTPAGDENDEVVLWVSREDAARAHRAVVELDLEHAAERARLAPATESPRPAPVEDGAGGVGAELRWSLGAVWLLMVSMLAQTYVPGWEERGILDAAAFQGGELERAITAITLHSSVIHLLANSAFLLIFGVATVRHAGAALAAAVGVGSGALANVVSALAHGAGFRSLGASGATFALLGLAAALAVHRRPRDAVVRWLPAVGAALGLLAFTGVAPQSDLVAHGAGLVLGFACGLGLPRLGQLESARLARLERGVGALTAAVVAGAWLTAMLR